MRHRSSCKRSTKSTADYDYYYDSLVYEVKCGQQSTMYNLQVTALQNLFGSWRALLRYVYNTVIIN